MKSRGKLKYGSRSHRATWFISMGIGCWGRMGLGDCDKSYTSQKTA